MTSEEYNQLEKDCLDRKLARTVRVKDVKVHPTADNLEILTIEGWQVVSQKGAFTVDSIVAFFEIDSVCPETETFAFLAEKKYRVKTIKLRGQISQGLCIPLQVLADDPKIPGIQFDDTILKYVMYDKSGASAGDWTAGEVINADSDLTQAIGVTKYVIPIPMEMRGQAKGSFPHFVPKTDQNRCQNEVDRIAQAFATGEQFEVTTKLDGQSFTAYYKDGEIGCCTRNFELRMDGPESRLITTFTGSGLANALQQYGKNIAVQMEFMGLAVQGNREKLPTHTLFVYDIFDIDQQCYLKPKERIRTFENLKQLSNGTFHHVPIIQPHYTLSSGDINSLLQFAEGPSLNHPVREGIVLKSHTTNFTTKAISNRFLLKEAD